MKFPASGLYAITQTDNKSPDTVLSEVAAAIRGGAIAVQYRDKHPLDALALGKALVKLCHQHQVPLLINDDVELALRTGADGVHIGKDDGHIAEARKHLGANAIIGVSCYDSVERAIEAQQHGADYIAFGRFFPSGSKPLAAPAHIETLKTARPLLHIPVVAIGGIFDQEPEQSARAYQPLFSTKTSKQ